MEKTIKWQINTDGEIESEDGSLVVYQDGGNWIMKDQIDSDILTFRTQKEVLDAGAKRLMITKMGNFSVFLGVMKESDLVFKHLIF